MHTYKLKWIFAYVKRTLIYYPHNQIANQHYKLQSNIIRRVLNKIIKKTTMKRESIFK